MDDLLYVKLYYQNTIPVTTLLSKVLREVSLFILNCLNLCIFMKA